MNKTKRNYDMQLRADAAAKTLKNIMEAAQNLWMELPYHEITLEKIACRAGVTVRTVLRKFGSKEELLKACIEDERSIIVLSRNEDPTKPIAESLASLIGEYERMGDAAIRTILVSEEVPVAAQILEKGRTIHKNWCEKIFAAYLPARERPDYSIRLHAFIAATEFYLWKLLRRDLKLSQEDTLSVFQTMIDSLILSHSNQFLK